MPMIAIDKNGRFIQSDGARHDGKGFGRMASMVDESSVILSPASIAHEKRQNEIENLGFLKKIEKRNQQIQAQMGKDRADAQKRAEVAQKPRSGATRDELLILGESMKMKRAFGSAADFSQWNTIPVKSDFGGEQGVDFTTYSTYTDPYIADPYAGIQTDFDRYIQAKPIAPSVGTIPKGMGYADQAPRSPWKIKTRKPGQSMGSFFSDLTGINIDVTSEAEQAIDTTLQAAQDNPQQTMSTLTQIGQSLGLVPKPATTTTTKPTSLPRVSMTTPPWLVGTTTLPLVGVVQKKSLMFGLAGLAGLAVVMIMMRRRSAT